MTFSKRSTVLLYSLLAGALVAHAQSTGRCYGDWRDLFSGCGQPVQTPPPAPQLTIELANPTFERGVVLKFQIGNGQQVETALNSDYFATEETAQKVASVFGARAVVRQRPGFSPGLYSVEYADGTPAYERWVLFPAGSKLRAADGSYFVTEAAFQENAGLLAAYFARNPEKD